MENVELADDLRIDDKSLQTLVLSAVAVGTTVWGIGFNLGAFGTVFFDDTFTIWVVSTAVFLSLVCTNRGRKRLRWYSSLILLGPSFLIGLDYVENFVQEVNVIDNLILLISLGVGVISLPYSAFVVVSILNPDLMDLKTRKTQLLIGAVGVFFIVAGFTVGANNYLFLSCADFKVSGNDLPANCRKVNSD